MNSLNPAWDLLCSKHIVKVFMYIFFLKKEKIFDSRQSMGQITTITKHESYKVIWSFMPYISLKKRRSFLN